MATKFMTHNHGRMAGGGHGLPNVLLEPTKPFSFMACGRATSETDVKPFQGWPASRAGSLQPSSTPLDTPYHTLMFMTQNIWALTSAA
jgi:hypothetical protein